LGRINRRFPFERHVRNDLPWRKRMHPVPHLHVQLRYLDPVFRFKLSGFVHVLLLVVGIWTHLSDKDGLPAARAPRASAGNPNHGVALRDHVTSYSSGNTEPARMMTPFLASNVFGSIRSNSTTSFCPSLNWHGNNLAASSMVWMLRGHHI